MRAFNICSFALWFVLLHSLRMCEGGRHPITGCRRKRPLAWTNTRAKKKRQLDRVDDHDGDEHRVDHPVKPLLDCRKLRSKEHLPQEKEDERGNEDLV